MENTKHNLPVNMSAPPASITETRGMIEKTPHLRSPQPYSKASKRVDEHNLCGEARLPFSGLVDNGAWQKLSGWTQRLADPTELDQHTPPLLPEVAENDVEEDVEPLLLPASAFPSYEEAELDPLAYGVVDEVVNELILSGGHVMAEPSSPALTIGSSMLLKSPESSRSKTCSPLPPCVLESMQNSSTKIDSSIALGLSTPGVEQTSKEEDQFAPGLPSEVSQPSPSLTLVDQHDSTTEAKRFVRWTQQEDDMLAHAVETEGGTKVNWKIISEVYFNGIRKPNQCKGRWKKLRPGLKRSAWSKEEDKQFRRYKEQGLNFSEIAAKLDRNTDSVRDRWLNVLDPNLDKRPLTQQERQIIFEAQQRFGNKWATIAKMLPGRSENMVKNCFHNAKMVTRRRMRKAAAAAMKQKAK